MLFYYHCHIVNGVEDIKDFFICIIIIDRVYILDIEVLDKRHVGLISTNMENDAVARSLDRLNKDAQVVELVTDASTSVKALLGESSHFLTFN